MVDEKLFSDLVNLYDRNIKAFQAQNTGLIVDKVYPLEMSDIEEALNTKELINLRYISTHYGGFTINPIIVDTDKRNGIYRVTIKPDISWEKQYYD